MPVTIEVSNLTKDFGEIAAVSDLSFKARSGEIIALLGPNGAGKSTLMNMITGYLAPTSGSIKVMEKDISGAPLEAKKLIGFLPEGSPLYPDMSVRSFLEYMAELRGFSRNEKKTAAAGNCPGGKHCRHPLTKNRNALKRIPSPGRLCPKHYFQSADSSFGRTYRRP